MRDGARRSARLLAGLVGTSLALIALLGAPPALAAAPRWVILTTAAPSNLPPGGEANVFVTASNGGDVGMNAEKAPITITVKLPAGLTATAVKGEIDNSAVLIECSGPSPEPSCIDKEANAPHNAVALEPGRGLRMLVKVKVAPGLESGSLVHVEAKATGGEAAEASASDALNVNSQEPTFGVEKYELRPEEEDGSVAAQAGSHPFQLTTTFSLNQNKKEEGVQLPKNLQFNLPAGLIGNPTAIPRCSQADFATILEPGSRNLCGPETAVGMAEVTFVEPATFGVGSTTRVVPVFNIEPAPGEPARLGLVFFRVPVVIETAVRTGSDYGVVATAKSTSQAAGIVTSRVTIWGVPGDPRHNVSRGWECVEGGLHNLHPPFPTCAEQKPVKDVPFLNMPTQCETPLTAPMRAQSWEPKAEYLPPVESEFTETMTGCNALEFTPALQLAPETETPANAGEQLPCSTVGHEPGYVVKCPGSTPTGLGVKVTVPQQETPTTRAQSAVRSTEVTLPEGMQLNAGAANGLEACEAFQVGLEPGFAEEAQTENDHFSPAPAVCADRAKVGTVVIKSPDLEEPLSGSVYIAREHTNPFEAPLVIYLAAENKKEGVVVKLAGKVIPNPATGRITSIFEHTPDVPFEEFQLKFFTGPRASSATPPLCGIYEAATSMTPWSTGSPAPVSGLPFEIVSGPGGGSCPSNPLPFSPSVEAGPETEAGSSEVNAGAFGPLDVTIHHPDGNQALQGLTVHLPKGAAAKLSSVTPCPEPLAARNECGPESLIGETVASSGLGSEPFTLGGKVYLTGPYKGVTVPASTPPAPFGLSVVTPAVAGPFNLGIVTVRSRIDVDPYTAAVTVTSDPFPTIIKGAPVQLKQIHVVTFGKLPEGRGYFAFNPTNCNPLEITGTLGGAEGATIPFSDPMKVNNCSRLPFKPGFEAEAEGQGSKPNGIGFKVITTSQGIGADNIARVHVALPIQLPSRLTTIQKACLLAAFNEGGKLGEKCPEGSNIGSARIETPVLKNPLSGPAYLVSHGNEAFPDVEFVLQGEGLTLILDGKTDIKKGITYSTFEATPDAPFTRFETTLPAGPHSALTANVPESKKFNLCGERLIMPTELTSQDGRTIVQETKIKITGCRAPVSLTKAQLLKKALAACRHKFRHNRRKRHACEAQARRKYGAKHATKHHKHR